jgi:predicted  nucleic acid-binding Zn-ribbon protein
VSDAPEIIDAAAIFQRFPDTWDTIYQYIKKLEQENDALNEAVESLRTTLWGMEAELEKAQKTAALLRGTVEALGDANDRLTIEITALRKQAKP